MILKILKKILKINTKCHTLFQLVGIRKFMFGLMTKKKKLPPAKYYPKEVKKAIKMILCLQYIVLKIQ